MLFYYQSWMFYNHFIVILHHFLVLTYWHSAPCQLLFSACFLHCRKSIPNGVQMQQNFLWIFSGPEDTPVGPEKYQRGAPRGAQPTRARQEAQARPGGLCPPRVPPDRLFAPYSRNPRGINENQFQSLQVPEPPDPIYTPSRRGSSCPLVPLRWCVSSSL